MLVDVELTWQLTMGLDEQSWCDVVEMLDQVVEQTGRLATKYRDPGARAAWVGAMVARRAAIELRGQPGLSADEGAGGVRPGRG
jgi:hypothetical protein